TVDSAPHSGSDSTVYGGTHERKDVVHGLSGQSFPFRALVLDFPTAFLGFVFPMGVFRSCALRLESKFEVSSTTGRA
ncbi:hypothetical protein, partial [uncultured Bilophila sp.]|uniref:hypothetical protein n=1 Tax=uncultured Bilophila sp. TaxID=529385 RepID=UPI00266E90CD